MTERTEHGPAGLLDAAAAAAPDAPALITEDGRLTYGDVADDVARVRAGLSRLGIEPGDRVVLALGNTADFVSCYLALNGMGAVTVPLNPLAAPAEHLRAATIVRPPLVIAGGESFAGAGLVADALPDCRVVAPAEGGPPGAVPIASLRGKDRLASAARRADDVAVIAFTAGTTGHARGAMLTNRNLVANIDQIEATPGMEPQDGDVTLGVLPLFHIYGLNIVLAATISGGGAGVVVDRFEPVPTTHLILRAEVPVVTGAPTMYRLWADSTQTQADAFWQVRLCVSGADRLDPDLFAEFQRRFGVPIWEGYGLTETSPVVTSTQATGSPHPGRIGLPIHGVEVRLVDVDGQDTEEGDPGEILVRGDNVFRGYYEDPEATALVLRDGWLWTGDIACYDDHGILEIVDRRKDLIIVSGFNVYPGEVEDALLGHPDVAEAAAVGVPDPVSGEAVEAFVVPRRGSEADPEALRSFARQFLAAYKCPRTVRLVAELPRGLGGKLLRRRLRDTIL